MSEGLDIIKAFNGKMSIEGTQFCVLIGEDMQSGLAGFGYTLVEAVADLQNQYYNYSVRTRVLRQGDNK